MARHTRDSANEPSCECALIPSQTIRDFWEALASVVHGSFKKVSGVDVPSYLGYRCFHRRSQLYLSILRARGPSARQTSSTFFHLELSDASDANLVI